MSGAKLEEGLSALGLASDEARCYLALLSAGPLTARQLASRTGVSRGRIYEVVRGLLRKGAALEGGGKVKVFRPVEPGVAAANLLEERRQALARLEADVETLVERLEEKGASSEGPPDLIEHLHHRATIERRYQELLAEASSEVLAFVRQPYITSGPQYPTARPGVTVRVVYESEILRDEANAEEIGRLMSLGEESRHVPELPTRLVIFDQAVTLLPFQEQPDVEGNGSSSSLIVRHEGLSTLGVSAFERVWERAEPIVLERGPAQAGVRR